MTDKRSPLRHLGTDPASVRQRVEALEKIMERLITMNDAKFFTFKEIKDWVEVNL